MKPGPGDLGVHPGSRSPTNADEVELLLRAVPAVCFHREFEGCLFAPGDLSDRATPDNLTKLASAGWQLSLLEALARIETQALGDGNGGLKFLAHTLGHFLTVQKLPPAEHPLVVGMYLRSHARKNDTPDEPLAIGQKMDVWGED